MDPMTGSTSAAERLLEQKEALAQEITDALYLRMPALLEKHGEYGRGKCLQDMRYNLEHLAPAVDLGKPELFASYVRWLDGLLRARNVSTLEVDRSLEIMEERIRARFAPGEVDAIVPSIRAGRAVLAATVEAG